MIALDFVNGEAIAKQVLTPPSVYLDHWALMNIADSPSVAARFSSAIGDNGGTFVLSWLNFCEFAAVRDSVHATNAQSLFERIAPNVFFVEPNAFAVADAELRLMSGDAGGAPHSDGDMLSAYVGQDAESVDPLSPVGFFETVISWKLEEFKAKLADTIVERVVAMRKQYTEDSEFRTKVGRPAADLQVGYVTLPLLREVLNPILKDQKAGFSKNDAIDYVHAIVPACYCDHVLLDSRWCSHIRQAVTRLARNAEGFRVAEVYSNIPDLLTEIGA